MTQEQKFLGLTVALVAVAIIAVTGLVYPKGQTEQITQLTGAVQFLAGQVEALKGTDPTVGASGTRYPNGISADTTSPVAGEVRGTDLKITDDAAFTKSAFCLDGFATSTNTAVAITASTTATIEGTDGVLVYTFGTCP